VSLDDRTRHEVVTAPVTTSMTAIIRILDGPSGLVLFSQAFAVTP
jgi:hypothetical protein